MTVPPRRYTYLDTSAMMRLAESRVTVPTPRNAQIAPIVESIVEDQARKVLMSRLGVMEFRNNVATNWRSQENPQFDGEWAKGAVQSLMESIQAGSIEIVEEPARVTQKSCSLVDLATRKHGVAFRVWDAVHLVTALSIAHDADLKIDFVTTDDDFDRFADLFPHFRHRVDIQNIDPTRI